MNILLTPSQEYFKYIYVLLKSLYVNHPKEVINLFVCSDVEEDSRRELRHFFQQCMEGALTFIKSPQERIRGVYKTVDSFRPIEIYYKLFCTEVLPNDIDRILYLDVDTVVNGDISGLYYVDLLSDKYIVACGSTRFNTLSTWDKSKALKGQYFNSGVILFNMSAIRNDFDYDVFNSLRKEGDYYYDQGLLNAAFCGKTLYVPAELYNCRLNIIPKAATYAELDSRIIHYSGWRTPYKPWDLYFENTISEMGTFQEGEFSLSVKLNNMFSVWWFYANMLETEYVDRLRKELQCKMEWFKRGQLNYFKYTNQLLQKHLEKENQMEHKMKEGQKKLEFELKKYQDIKAVSKEWVDYMLKDKVKLALLGSCISRSALMRNSFFNEDYHEYVDLAYIHYHSSYVSLMSEKIDYETKGKKTKDASFQRSYETWAEIEFKKSFFNDIKNANPDYLIIDNYAEGGYYLYETADKKYFTCNYFIQSAGIPEEFEGGRFITSNSSEKWLLLEKSITAFYEKIQKILPLSRIILVKGCQSQKRILEDKIVFWDDAKAIGQRNEVWKRVDEYIVNKYPEIRVIDMTNTEYVSADAHPLGSSPAHYESGYYRKLFLEYNKIFIEDRKRESILLQSC